MRVDLTMQRPDGRRRDVALFATAGVSGAAVVGALKEALAVHPSGRLSVDGATCPDEPREWTRQLRPGSVIGVATAGPAPAATVRLIVAAGRDCGSVFEISRCSAVLGRDPGCDITVDDPDVSRRHAVFEADGDVLTVRDLNSTNGTRVNGVAITARQIVSARDMICVGNTALRVDSGSAANIADGATTVHWPARPQVERIAPLPLAASLGSAGAAVAIGAMTHSTAYLALSLITPVVLLAGWCGAWLRSRLRRKRRLSEYAEHVAQAERAVVAGIAAEVLRRRSLHPDPVELAVRLSGGRIAGTSAAAASTVRIGLADQRAQLAVVGEDAPARDEMAPLVPVDYEPTPGILRISGDRDGAVRLARWILVQLCAAGPVTWEGVLVVDAARDRAWTWARWLPRLRTRPPLRQAEPMPAPVAGSRVVLVDLAEDDSYGEAALTQCYPGSLVIVIDGTSEPRRLPSLHVLANGCITGGGSTVQHAIELPDHIIADGIDADLAESVARLLAGCTPAMPEGSFGAPRGLLSLLADGDGDAAPAAASRWQHTDGGAAAIVGVETSRTFAIDLCRDGPHALIVGTTGSGKSELLQTWVAGLALSYPPDELAFVLIDYKGGAAFGGCAALPHVTSVVTDLDGDHAARALQSLQAELRRRETMLAEAGVPTFTDYCRSAGRGQLPRLVIMIDEFAALAQEQPAFIDGLVSVAQRGRSLGLHLVLATQRAGSAISSDIRANTALRIALRVADPGESHDIIGAPDAARIPADEKGAAVVLAADGRHAIRVARVGGPSEPADRVRVRSLDGWGRLTSAEHDQAANAPAETELDVIVRAVATVAQLSGRRAHPAPWLPPLPDQLALDDLPTEVSPHAVPFGLLDLPDEQRQLAASINLLSGASLVFAGPPRSGRTTALRTVAVSAARRLRADQLIIYAIDAAGGALCAGVQDLPHTATAASTDDPDLVARLIARLHDELRRRQLAAQQVTSAVSATAGGRPSVLVLVDGRAELVRAMDDIDHGRTSQCFAALVAQGPAVGMSFVSTTAEAEIGRLAAATEGYGLGVPNPRAHVPMTRVGSARPGRGTRLRDGAMLQVASASPDPGVVRPPANRVDRIVIRPLPYRVVLEEIAASDGGFVIGVGGDSAAPVRVDLIAGSARMLVAGPPSSGKSTALLSLLVQALARSVPVCVAAADRSPLTLAARAHGLHVLLPHDRCPEIDCAGGIVLIDDVDRFVDSPAADALTTVIRSASRAAAVVASGDATELSILQRSPIVELRRGRTGLLLQPRAVDAELVGLRLPRSVPTHVPGRGLLVAGTELLPGPARHPLPVQVAIPTPAPDRAVVNPYAGSGGRSAGRTSP